MNIPFTFFAKPKSTFLAAIVLAFTLAFAGFAAPPKALAGEQVQAPNQAQGSAGGVGSAANAACDKYVAPNGVGSGASWTSPSGNPQAMMDELSASLGGIVCVAQGTYSTSLATQRIAGDERSKSFLLKNGVTLRGGFDKTETNAMPNGGPETTIFTGLLTDGLARSYHVFYNSALD
jgi:hypothetical protein